MAKKSLTVVINSFSRWLAGSVLVLSAFILLEQTGAAAGLTINDTSYATNPESLSGSNSSSSIYGGGVPSTPSGSSPQLYQANSESMQIPSQLNPYGTVQAPSSIPSAMPLTTSAINQVPGQQLTGPGINGEKGGAPVAAAAVGVVGAENFRSQQAAPTPHSQGTSSIEKLFVAEPVSAENSKPQPFSVTQLAQFGYNYFRPDTSGFSSMTDVPVGPDYMLGVGDRIVLTLWGSIDGVYELEINRQGEVVLPKVGPVRLVGTTFEHLAGVLRTNLAKVFKDFQLNVNIGKLRSMKIYVVGDVRQPGDYTISSLSTVITALSAAGGPTKDGTLRNIQIKRNGKLVESVDLYDFFLSGDKSRDIRLQPGDTIFVPSIGPVAGIAGVVRRPAIYELKGETNLKELMEMAGGMNSGGHLRRLQILRVEAHSRKSTIDVNIDPAATGKTFEELAAGIKLSDMDMVKIFPIDPVLRGYVRLSGHILRPGDYALKAGMRISDLLTTENILPEYDRNVGEITRLLPPDNHPEKIQFVPSRALSGDVSQNLELQEFDEVRIFSRWEMEEMPMVRISGDVQKPGNFRLFENMTIRDLLLLAGNPKRTAYLKSAEIARIKKDGESVTSFSILVNLEEALKGNPAHNIKLEPFDEMTVRRIPNWADENDRYITLKGEFVFPGTYPIYKGERLSSVIHRAGGYTEKAYLKSAKLIRKQVQEIQQKRMNEVLSRTEIDLHNKQAEIASTASSKEELAATQAAMAAMITTVKILKSVKAEGRMVIKLLPLDQLANSEYDFEVVGGDQLDLSTDPRVVNVLGEVYNQTSFMFQPSAAVGDYLYKSGGMTRSAEDSDAFIVKIDGTVVSRNNHANGFLGYGGFMFMHPDSGDTIVIPKQLERIAWMREIKDIAIILGQLALTAGIVIAAGL